MVSEPVSAVTGAQTLRIEPVLEVDAGDPPLAAHLDPGQVPPRSIRVTTKVDTPMYSQMSTDRQPLPHRCQR